MQTLTPLMSEVFKKISTELSEQHLSVTDNFLPLNLYKNICQEVRLQHLEGLTRPAQIGRLASSRINSMVRGDKIHWVGKEQTHQKVHPVFDIIENLRIYLRGNLLLPLHDTEQHFAVYPPGTYYRKHLDCHKNLNNRVITFILYLNRRNWSHNNGGQLRVWLNKDVIKDFLPLGNRLITFSSYEYFHEVLPALTNRYSLTGWFRKDAYSF